jgi:NAD(P)H-nitrite reductase large subunit
MDLDDDLCLCFHVSKRKVINYLRIHQPRRVGELSECFGAGTGCGWCRPFLQRLFDQSRESAQPDELPAADDYARQRQRYIREKEEDQDDSQ